MSLVANEKGVEFSTLRIINSSPNVQTTLEKKMLSKMETYSAVVKTFYTNSVPSLIPEDFVLMKILPKRDINADVLHDWDDEKGGEMNHHLAPVENHQLVILRNETHNILGLVHKISQFCDSVNKKIFVFGTNFGNDAQYHIDANLPAGIYNVVEPSANGVAIHYISFSIDATGRAIFKFNQEFLSQFYVELDPDFAKVIDVESVLWAGTDEIYDTLIYAGTDNEVLYVNGIFEHDIQAVTPGGRGVSWISNRSIFLVDRRLSLVVEMSMPFSRTVLSEDGKHVEKYRLAEFPIDGYIESKGSAQSINGQVQSKVKTTDTLQGGLTDFTRGFPETHIIHFLPGDLYTVNTRLYIIYRGFTGGKVEMPFAIGDGFFDLEVLFVKKAKNGAAGQHIPQSS